MNVLTESLERMRASFNRVKDGKEQIADAITRKGVYTLGDSSFDQMALNISLIEGGDSTDISEYFTQVSPITNITFKTTKPLKSSCFQMSSLETADIEAGGGQYFQTALFQGDKKLKSVKLHYNPVLTNGSYIANCFRECSSLEFVDLDGINSFGQWFFYECSNLKTVILRNPNVVGLYGSDFDYTPFKNVGNDGRIYVPINLIESYKSNAKWKTYYDSDKVHFYPIEGSIYE